MNIELDNFLNILKKKTQRAINKKKSLNEEAFL